jgi:hypothetical protein
VTLTLDHREAESDRGGAGTMAVPIPPSVTQITGLRIAGAENKGGVTIRLYRGGREWGYLLPRSPSIKSISLRTLSLTLNIILFLFGCGGKRELRFHSSQSNLFINWMSDGVHIPVGGIILQEGWKHLVIYIK